MPVWCLRNCKVTGVSVSLWELGFHSPVAASESRQHLSVSWNSGATGGPTPAVAIVPGRAGIAFHVRSTFATLDRLTARTLSAHVVLSRRHDDPRFTKVAVRAPRHQIHYFRAQTLDDLDEDVAGWLAEAYQVGAGSEV